MDTTFFCPFCDRLWCDEFATLLRRLMAIFKLPRYADHISSATVRRWLVSLGNVFDAGTELIELVAEEAIVTVAATDAGVLIKPLVTIGQTVLIGAELAQVEMSSHVSLPQPFNRRRSKS